jgi:hypothetical protein
MYYWYGLITAADTTSCIRWTDTQNPDVEKFGR